MWVLRLLMPLKHLFLYLFLASMSFWCYRELAASKMMSLSLLERRFRRVDRGE